jgi:hypothetical protein
MALLVLPKLIPSGEAANAAAVDVVGAIGSLQRNDNTCDCDCDCDCDCCWNPNDTAEHVG